MNSLLPDILAVRCANEAKVAIDLHVPAALIHFPGHFPDMAILPGVVQIDWAVRLARAHLPITGEFEMMESIKFQAFLLPGMHIELVLTWDVAKRRLEFTYASSQRRYSSGRIVFGGVV
jgi:3-hydroxymyristoyl/3-hydroxydecanoyl-(acyl carrier protein) dehydratase